VFAIWTAAAAAAAALRFGCAGEAPPCGLRVGELRRVDATAGLLWGGAGRRVRSLGLGLPRAARVFPSAVVHAIGRALMPGAQIGIRDAQGQAVVSRVELDATVGDALDALNRARPAGWPAIASSQLSVCPGAGWAVPLETEVAGGLLLPLAELQTETVEAPAVPEFYFFSPTSLGSGAGGYVPSAVAAPAPAPAPVPKASPSLPVALIFPGQGSQSVGMLKDVKGLPAVAEMFRKAQAILGYDLLDIITNGPEETLTQTKYCQPAMFIAGLAAVEKLRQTSPEVVDGCRATAGLSLGEYTALTFAGALTFEDGLRLVKLRAEAMQEAATNGKPGAMLSVVGLEKEKLVALCEQTRTSIGGDTVCQIANELFPKGNVAAGDEAAIEALTAAAKAAGAQRAARPKTSGAFHSPLMAPAGAKLAAALAQTTISFPRVQVYSNVAARPYSSAEEILELLAQQLTSPVLWNTSVGQMKSDGITEFYETGPQTQLKSMMRRIDPKLFAATKSVTV
jgi:[acyl-carrier-protein] S-malonyltransferase